MLNRVMPVVVAAVMLGAAGCTKCGVQLQSLFTTRENIGCSAVQRCATSRCITAGMSSCTQPTAG